MARQTQTDAKQRSISDIYRGHSDISCATTTEVSCGYGALGKFLESIDVLRHEFLEHRPHLEAEGENVRLEWATAPPLHLRDDVLRQADNRQ